MAPQKVDTKLPKKLDFNESYNHLKKGIWVKSKVASPPPFLTRNGWFLFWLFTELDVIKFSNKFSLLPLLLLASPLLSSSLLLSLSLSLSLSLPSYLFSCLLLLILLLLRFHISLQIQISLFHRSSQFFNFSLNNLGHRRNEMIISENIPQELPADVVRCKYIFFKNI